MTLYPGFDAEDTTPARGDREIHPGIVLERRSLITGAVGAVALAGLARADDGDDPKAALPGTIDAFLDEAAPFARELLAAEDRNEDAYLYHLASVLARLTEPPPWPGEKTGREIAFQSNGRRQIGDGKRQSLALVQIRFEPGAVIPIHDHRNYNGVILGLEGEVRTRNFDVVEGDGTTDTVKVRETVDALVTPGRFSNLSTTRDNLHELTGGGEGGRVLDIFTYFGSGAGSHYLELEGDDPVDADRRVWAARWKRRGR